jgi:hypothetical protein
MEVAESWAHRAPGEMVVTKPLAFRGRSHMLMPEEAYVGSFVRETLRSDSPQATHSYRGSPHGRSAWESPPGSLISPRKRDICQRGSAKPS